MNLKSGFISIIGKPNVGKSTLLNYLLEEKIAIVSNKPQTTRNKILGIKNTTCSQMIFLDTPGIHKAKSQLNKYMVKEAIKACGDVDIILFLVEANTGIGDKDQFVIEAIEKVKSPIILVINKIDLIRKESLLPLIDQFSKLYNLNRIVPISALSGEGVDKLIEEIEQLLPFGPQYFPEDMITDLPERFIVAEIIREKVFRLTSQEIPYSVAVVIDAFKERENADTIFISATIHVEKISQKGILIGKKGSMLKQIGTMARFDIEKLLGAKVYLELRVRVEKDWSKNIRVLGKMGYK
ncbi:MAG: GTPase Era [Pseudomonadota bacterium]